jgi:hypothetical protein
MPRSALFLALYSAPMQIYGAATRFKPKARYSISFSSSKAKKKILVA